ncbi:MAG: hypothetical protein U0L26_07080 [Cellulosilyticum sp.]|nr:hypothetical protein [Cellulosilyticum sp.]MEE1072137.1 hypothetical protein [Cellulosilyticum sp.]
MDKEMAKKLIKAKILEGEVLREVILENMPDKMKERVGQFETEIKDLAKEVVWEYMMTGDAKSKMHTEDNGQNNQSTHTEKNHGSNKKTVQMESDVTKKSKVQKIEVEF